MSGPERATVGVTPAAEARRRPRLLAALELAHPVRFETRDDAGLRGLDAVLDLGSGKAAEAALGAGLPALRLVLPESERPGAAVVVELGSEPPLDRCLRGAALPDDRLLASARAAGSASGTPAPPPGATAFARGAGLTTWWRQGRLQVGLLAPAELAPEEALRDRLGRERSAALLPLLHFLRGLCAGRAWRQPLPRAAIVFDDPNLRRPSYGYLDLAALARHARRHGYHAVLATVPLDLAAGAHPAARRALAAADGAISLVVHGNDHDGAELGRLADAEAATRLAAQAVRRVAGFERDTGLAVERVMVPPHEACSEATVAGLSRCGFEAISMTRPFPWLGGGGDGWLARPAGADALVGWRPCDRASGLPVLLRHPLAGRSSAELRLRAYLGQPLILYGHHEDLAGGLDVLAEAAAELERIAPVEWSSLAAIARGGFETQRRGGTLAVRPLSRRLRLAPPAGVAELVVERPPFGRAETGAGELTVDGREVRFGEPVALAGGAVTIEHGSACQLEVASVAPPRSRRAARPRRLAGEWRDRLRPLLAGRG